MRVHLQTTDSCGVDHVRSFSMGFEQWEKTADAMNHPMNVDTHDPIPIGQGILLQGHAMHGHASIVDGDVQFAPSLDNLIRSRLHR